MIAVVETEEFLTDVKSVLSDIEHDALVLYVAQHPEAGDTRNTRPPKVAVDSQGQGQTRRIAGDLLLHNLDMPLFLMAIYAKNVQGDLSPQQRKTPG